MGWLTFKETGRFGATPELTRDWDRWWDALRSGDVPKRLRGRLPLRGRHHPRRLRPERRVWRAFSRAQQGRCRVQYANRCWQQLW